MPQQRTSSSSTRTRPNTVYVVLQRETLERAHQHDCSCVSVHTTLADANQAVIDLYDIDEDDEQEDEWLSWEDLDGARVQTNSTGAVRVIQVSGNQYESVAWVEKKTIQGRWGGDGKQENRGCEDDDETKRTVKKRKVSSRTIFSALTGDHGHSQR